MTRMGSSRTLCASVLGKTGEPAPEECRYYPGSHADLASFGDETEWDVVDVGCCKLNGKGGEEGCDCCLLFLRETPRCSCGRKICRRQYLSIQPVGVCTASSWPSCCSILNFWCTTC